MEICEKWNPIRTQDSEYLYDEICEKWNPIRTQDSEYLYDECFASPKLGDGGRTRVASKKLLQKASRPQF